MAVIAFRHTPCEPIGLIANALEARGVDWHYIDCWNQMDPHLPVDQAQALIVLGGPMSVNDPLPWLRIEEACILRAIAHGVPVLGICLGAQLLAKCLGAKVYPMDRKEIGWYPIRLTESAASDPLFEGLNAEETVFQWHGEMFDLPPGSQRLAQSDICPNQAFRAGTNLYGLQFHPEVTPQIIGDWCEHDRSCGPASEVERPIDPSAYRINSRLLDNWCDLVL